MLAEARVPIIAFLWGPEEIGPPVTQMAHRTGSGAIFDFSFMGAEALHSLLQRTNSVGHINGIKISAQTLMDPSLVKSLKDTGVQDIWVECQLPFSQVDPSAFLQLGKLVSANQRLMVHSRAVRQGRVHLEPGNALGELQREQPEHLGCRYPDDVGSAFSCLKTRVDRKPPRNCRVAFQVLQ